MGIRMDQFTKKVMNALKDFAEMEIEVMKEEAKKTAKNAAKELKKTSPKRTGEYAKNWKNTVKSETAVKINAVVYNDKHYRLTHLLENGHDKRGGGRVSAKVHIAPVDEKAAKEFEERLLKKL